MNQKSPILALVAVLVSPLLVCAQPTTMPTEEVRIPLLRSLTKFTLVKIPPGEVEIVDKEGKAQKAPIKSFWIGQTEQQWDVYDDFRLCMDVTVQRGHELKVPKLRPSEPYTNPDYSFGHQGFAAISIHPKAALAYCEWLSQITGKKYRLATEAEWEYACRAGGPVEDLSDLKKHAEWLKEMAWFAGNSKNDVDDLVPHACATKAPNAWGLYDMLGNVGEWVTAADAQLVIKGGWYDCKAKSVHSRARAPYTKDWQTRDPQDPKSKWWLSDAPHAGFRIVREE